MLDLGGLAGAGPPPGPPARRLRRIIPVSSGKGGVGKTTFALNYALALSQHGRTVLVDLDTGTSSVRAALDVPVRRDLYHFFRRGASLDECVTHLDRELDPAGRWQGFGFVAAPAHFIDDLGQLDGERRARLLEACETLAAEYVVLDLRAGLDDNVLGFLPAGNSGILVFTPHLQAATLAAADIVRALLLRRLRALAAEPGTSGDLAEPVRRALIERVADCYADQPLNLDGLVEALRAEPGGERLALALSAAVDSFAVHFVLNMFNGVQHSFEGAVRPFLERLERDVSAHLALVNLGWVVAHEDFDRAARARLPVLLYRERQPSRPQNRLDEPGPDVELARLAARYRTVRPPGRRQDQAAQAFARSLGVEAPARSARHLDAQLELLARMYGDLRGAGYADNFHYLAHRSLHVLRSRPIPEFGRAPRGPTSG